MLGMPTLNLLMVVVVLWSSGNGLAESEVRIVNEETGIEKKFCGSISAPCKRLDQAVNNCGEGGTVVVIGHTAVTSQIKISKNISIIGRDEATIEGSLYSSLITTVFRLVRPVTVYLQNLSFKGTKMITLHSLSVATISNCNAEPSALQIALRGSMIEFSREASSVVLNITNCSFTGYRQNDVYISKAKRFYVVFKIKMTFENCTFVDILGLRFEFIDSIDLKIRNCSFHRVRCSAIYLVAPALLPISRSNISIRRSSFINSEGCNNNYGMYKEQDNGGAINIMRRDTSLDISNSEFKNSRTNCVSRWVMKMMPGHGGAIYFTGENSTIDIERTKFHGNVACGHGGDLHLLVRRVNITECLFHYSKATHDGQGGSIFFDSRVHRFWKIPTTVIIYKCEFINGKTTTKGGAVALKEVDITLLTKCKFRDNIAKDEGGALWMETNGAIELRSCYFHSNLGNFGGALMLRRLKGSFFSDKTVGELSVDSTFFNNNHAVAGGGLYLDKGKFPGHSGIHGCVFSNNSASSYGQSIYNNDRITMVHTFVESHEKFIAPHLRFDDGDISIRNVSVHLHRESRYSLPSKSYAVVFSSNDIKLSRGFTLTCPMNFNVREMKITSNVVGGSETISRGLIRPRRAIFKRYKVTKYKSFSVKCASCPFSKYTLHSGRLHVPRFSSNVPPENNITTENQECKACPVGAICDTALKALDHFWGHTDSATLFMNVCPRGFCCGSDTVPCITYDTCAVGRKGTLCGTCSEGYKQNFYGESCIPQGEVCDPRIFATYFVLYSLFYTTLIVLVTNLKDIVVLAKQTLLKDQPSDTLENTSEGGTDFSIAAFVQISILFYQVAGLLQVKFQDTAQSTNSTSSGGITHAITEVFHFRYNIYQKVCPSNELTLSQKEMILFGIKMATFLHLALFVFVYKIVQGLGKVTSRSTTSMPPTEEPSIELMADGVLEEGSGEIVESPEESTQLSFMNMLKCTFIKLLKLYYTPVTISALNMIHCVNINNESRLYVYGDHVCYSPWQLAIMCVLLPSILMFPICFELALRMLKDNSLSSWQFVCANACPFYALIPYAWTKCRRKYKKHTKSSSFVLSWEEKSFRQTILQGEETLFREVGNHSVGWQIIQFYRTFTITVLSIFIINPIYRQLAYTLLIAVFIIHDRNRKPYKHYYLNTLQSLASRCLIIVVVCNTIPAMSYLVNVRNVPSISEVMKVLRVVELTVYAIVPLSLPAWKLKTFIDDRRKERDGKRAEP